MVKCTKCGAEKVRLIKTWPIPSRKPLEKREAKLAVGIFQCESCNAVFRASLENKSAPEETVSIKNMAEKIKGIREEFMQTLKNLREKIKTLESERSNLMVEIEKLRKAAESKASALESEVNMLREEVKSLRELLGYTEEK